MSIVSIIAIIAGVFIALISLYAIMHTEKPIKKIFFGSFKGLFAFVAVNLAGIFTGVSLPVSFLSLAIAIVGGIPGVTVMVILNMLL